MRKLLAAAAGIAALALGSTGANAAALVTSPGTLTPPASAFFGNAMSGLSTTTTNFNDSFAFTIGGSGSALTDAQVSTILLNGIQNVSFGVTAGCPGCGIFLDLNDAAHRFVQTQSDPIEQWALLAPLVLGPGPHTIFANGTVTGPTGSYSGTLNVQAAPSVPEPATWAMMLVGFAGVGMALRRSRRLHLAQLA